MVKYPCLTLDGFHPGYKDIVNGPFADTQTLSVAPLHVKLGRCHILRSPGPGMDKFMLSPAAFHSYQERKAKEGHRETSHKAVSSS